MPIRFRCSYCNRLLGIATRKAGLQTTCPHCGESITVPTPDSEEAGEPRVNLDDITELLERSDPHPAMTAPAQPVSSHTATAPPPTESSRPGQPPPVPVMVTKPPEERPLFEGDVDAILGSTPLTQASAKPKVQTTSGMDAMSLGDHPPMSAGKATLLMIVVALLLALAFAAGLFLAPKG